MASKAKVAFVNLLFIAIASSLLVISFLHFFSLVVVSGNSMYPTYNNGEVIVLRKKMPLEINDTVTFIGPESWGYESKTVLIKRIIAAEGDKLYVDGNEIYVNGVIVRELPSHLIGCTYDGVIPADTVYVMGDNSAQSNDSLFSMCNDIDDFTVNIYKQNVQSYYGREMKDE